MKGCHQYYHAHLKTQHNTKTEESIQLPVSYGLDFWLNTSNMSQLDSEYNSWLLLRTEPQTELMHPEFYTLKTTELLDRMKYQSM